MQNSECKMQNLNGIVQMKNYINPEIEVVEVCTSDIITTSPGTETGIYDESDGNWDLAINP